MYRASVAAGKSDPCVPVLCQYLSPDIPDLTLSYLQLFSPDGALVTLLAPLQAEH